ncbi:MAG: hypothetical protein QM811_03520 [Pirellulales bacterium]
MQFGSLAADATGIVQAGSQSGTKTFEVGALEIDTPFAGQIKDHSGATGGTLSLRKTGLEDWTFNGASTATGDVVVADGRLLVTANASITGNILEDGGELSTDGDWYRVSIGVFQKGETSSTITPTPLTPKSIVVSARMVRRLA